MARRRQPAFPVLLTDDLTKPSKKTTAKVKRAEKKLPARPVPYVPKLKKPTPEQRELQRKIYKKNVDAQIPKSVKGKDRERERARVDAETKRDPRNRKKLQAYEKAFKEEREFEALRRILRGDSKTFKQAVDFGERKKKDGKSFGLAAITNELGGAGHLAAALNTVGETIGKGATSKLASVIPNPTAPASIVANTVPGAKKVMVNALKDVVNTPAQAVPSVYLPIREVAKGNPDKAAKMLVEPFVETAKNPGKSFTEHPVNTALLVGGVKGGAGRGAGKVMRSPVAPKRVREIASTQRESARRPGTTLEQKREYSKDVLTKAVQVQRERRKTRAADKLREKADEVERRDSEDAAADALEIRRKANAKDPRIISDRELRKRVDDRVALNELTRRQNRTLAIEQAARAISNTQTPEKGARVKTRMANRKTKAEPSVATTLSVQGIVRADPKDLAAYKQQLEVEFDGLTSKSQQAANKQLRAQIDKAIKGDLSGVDRAARRYAEEVARPRTQGLVQRGMLDADQADRATLTPYAVQHMGAKFDPESDRIVGKDGKTLTTADIREHLRANNAPEPGYVTQAPSMRGAANFFRNSMEPPSYSTRRRTGEATRRGTMDAHPDVLIEGAARSQGLIDAFDGFSETLQEFGARQVDGKGRGGYVTRNSYADIQKIKAEIEARTGERFKPVRVNPFAGRKAQLEEMLNRGGVNEASVTQFQEDIASTLLDAVEGKDGPGPWALIPEQAQRRQVEHLNAMRTTTAGKALQKASGIFRTTVLATSPPWITGNILEASLRAAFAGAGPRSYVTGRRAVEALARQDPKAVADLQNRVTGGGHFSMVTRQELRRSASQFEGTALERLAKAFGTFWETPGPKQAAGVWHWYTDLVFRQLNGKLESQFQTAMLGKALRDSPLMDGQMLKTSKVAVDQAARGLTNTAEQVRFARQVERMYGKYNAFGPDTKWTIAMYTPFIAWFKNAGRFVLDVLPRDHPVATSLIAASVQATEEWRKDHGLDLFMQGDGKLPPFLQGAIPTPTGGHQRTPFRYTPFSAFADPLGTAADSILPQGSGVLAAFKGEDWKGKELRDAEGRPVDELGKAQAAAESLADSMVPFLSIVKRVSKDGPNTLNPFKPIGGKQQSKATAGDEFEDIDWSNIEPVDDVDLDDLDWSSAVPATP